MTLLKLRMMRLVCDFMLDWYYFRHLPDGIKKKKMDIINSVREDVMEAILREDR